MVRQRDDIAAVLGAPAAAVRVVSGDIGGNFGIRNNTCPEFALVAWAAKRVGRPVKWSCERRDAFAADCHGRDLTSEAELALDKDGRFLAIRAVNTSNLGTGAVSFVPLAKGIAVSSGVYDIPCSHMRGRAVVTNTAPTSAYRSAGRPEVMFVLERLIDIACRRRGFDRLAIRLRNLVPPAAMPYRNPLGLVYDSGDYAASLRRPDLVSGREQPFIGALVLVRRPAGLHMRQPQVADEPVAGQRPVLGAFLQSGTAIEARHRVAHGDPVMNQNGKTGRRHRGLRLKGRIDRPQLLKAIAAIVARKPENRVSAVAEAGQKDFVLIAIVLGDGAVQGGMDIVRVVLCPSPYGAALRADHQEAGRQGGTIVRVPCRRSVPGNAVGVAAVCRLLRAVQKAQDRVPIARPLVERGGREHETVFAPRPGTAYRVLQRHFPILSRSDSR